MPRVCHGIFDVENGAVTRKSVFALMLDPKDWIKKEEKRIARAEKARKDGIPIADDAFEVHDADVVELDIPMKFYDILTKKSSVLSALYYYIPNEWVDDLPTVLKDSLRNLHRSVEFTIYEDEGISTFSMTHIGDNFSRKEGFKKAYLRWMKAYGAFTKRSEILDDAFTFYDPETYPPEEDE